MIHLVKQGNGFAVKSVADNGELLQSSETLNSKQNCYKNIRGMMESSLYDSVHALYVQDDALTGKPKMWLVPTIGNRVSIPHVPPKPKYQAGKNPKHKPTKK